MKATSASCVTLLLLACSLTACQKGRDSNPEANAYQEEPPCERVYRIITGPDAPTTELLDEYLRQCPESPHAAEVTTLRTNRAFQLLSTSAESEPIVRFLSHHCYDSTCPHLTAARRLLVMSLMAAEHPSLEGVRFARTFLDGSFIRQHLADVPDSRLKDLAQMLWEETRGSIPPDVQAVFDDHAFSEAAKEGTAKALEQYLTDYPNGIHRSEANARWCSVRLPVAEASSTLWDATTLLERCKGTAQEAALLTLVDDLTYKQATTLGLGALGDYVRSCRMGKGICGHQQEAVHLMLLRAAEGQAKPADFVTLVGDALTPDKARELAKTAGTGNVANLAAAMWDGGGLGRGMAPDDPYDRAFRDYVARGQRTLDSAAVKAVYGLMKWQQAHPGAETIVAIRQTSTRYTPIQTADLPQTDQDKIALEGRRLLQPSPGLFAKGEVTDRERKMLQHLASGMAKVTGVDSMKVRPGTEEEVRKAGAGVIVEYTLLPEGLRWGNELDPKAARLVFVDLHLRWNVQLRGGTESASVSWEIESEPPRNITVSNIEEPFEEMVRAAIPDFEKRFFAAAGIPFDVAKPQLARRLREWVTDQFLNGNWTQEGALLRELSAVIGEGPVLEAAARELGCTADEVQRLSELLGAGQIPGASVTDQAAHPAFVPPKVADISPNEELEVKALDGYWFRHRSSSGFFTVTAQASGTDSDVDLLVYRAAADGQSVSTGVESFALEPGPNETVVVRGLPGLYFVRVSNAQKQAQRFTISVQEQPGPNLLLDLLTALQPGEEEVRQILDHNPGSTLVLALGLSLKDRPWLRPLMEERLARQVVVGPACELWPELLPKVLAAAKNLEELLYLTRQFPAQARKLQKRLLSAAARPDQMVRIIETLGLDEPTRLKWRSVLLKSTEVPPAQVLRYLATVAPQLRRDAAVDKVFVGAMKRLAAARPGASDVAWLIRDYRLLVTEAPLDENAPIEVLLAEVSTDRMAPLKALWRPLVEASMSDKEVAAYLFAFPEDRQKLRPKLESPQTVAELKAFLELYYSEKPDMPEAEARRLLAGLNNTERTWQAYDALLARIPSVKEPLRRDFQNLVVALPRCDGKRSGNMVSAECNTEVVEDAYAAFKRHFPKESEELREKLAAAMDDQSQRAIRKAQLSLPPDLLTDLPLGQVPIPEPALPAAYFNAVQVVEPDGTDAGSAPPAVALPQYP